MHIILLFIFLSTPVFAQEYEFAVPMTVFQSPESNGKFLGGKLFLASIPKLTHTLTPDYGIIPANNKDPVVSKYDSLNVGVSLGITTNLDIDLTLIENYLSTKIKYQLIGPKRGDAKPIDNSLAISLGYHQQQSKYKKGVGEVKSSELTNTLLSIFTFGLITNANGFAQTASINSKAESYDSALLFGRRFSRMFLPLAALQFVYTNYSGTQKLYNNTQYDFGGTSFQYLLHIGFLANIISEDRQDQKYRTSDFFLGMDLVGALTRVSQHSYKNLGFAFIVGKYW